ncbi:MAG: SPFH domain-containing protein [Promethearchaeota archaeon]
MNISGKTPKVPHKLMIWYVLLGPVFTTDELGVRTKDNAVLLVRLRYKWRLRVDPEHPEKIFAVEDLIGFMTETMAGLIREEAAKHNFEDFHANAAEIVKKVIFPSATEGKGQSFVFGENGMEVFGIDIKRVVPEDPEIAEQLNAAIKSNMEVYVQKIQQAAQLEAEQELVRGRTEIEKSRGGLIALEQENLRARELGKAKIEADAAVEKAQGEAKAILIRAEAENEAEVARIKKTIEALAVDGGEAYIRLQQVASFENVDKTIIVPTDSRLFVPVGDASKGKGGAGFLGDED